MAYLHIHHTNHHLGRNCLEICLRKKRTVSTILAKRLGKLTETFTLESPTPPPPPPTNPTPPPTSLSPKYRDEGCFSEKDNKDNKLIPGGNIQHYNPPINWTNQSIIELSMDRTHYVIQNRTEVSTHDIRRLFFLDVL